jgi:NADH-quinone oxidoreductase subunit L
MMTSWNEAHWANAIWWVLLLPLGGFLFQAMAGGWVLRWLGWTRGRNFLGFMGVLPVALGFVISIGITAALSGLAPEARWVITQWFPWIDLYTLYVPWELRIDPLSMTMVLIVTGVGSIIHLYATGYMAEDRDYPRFFTYMNLFVFFMLLLVLANNFVVLFVGWEGVGLCSYLLIGYWYQNLDNARSANKAFIVNRIGDWGFVLGIFLLYVLYAERTDLLGSERRLLSFDVVFPHAQEVLGSQSEWVLLAVPLLLFVGAMGKSAQFPLYLWLPDAMAGPTPVSALIHAATMVTAGVYMVARSHVLFELSPEAMMVVAVVGTFTAFFAATVAFAQTDIKRVLAFSTVSQLGYMFLACGVGAFSSGMFHVTTHAFFKALLFLGAGAVIVAMAHEQDMRRYGNLAKYLPVTYFTMLVALLAISGIPPFAGFFSKDEILTKTFASQHLWGETWLVSPRFLYGVGLLTALLTALYMTRMFWLTFCGKQERWRLIESAEHEAKHPEPPPGFPLEEGEPEEDPHGFFLSPEEMHHEVEEEHPLTPDHHPREPGWTLTVPLVVLAFLSLVGGVVLAGGNPFSHLMGGDVPHYFEQWNASVLESERLARESYHVSKSVEGALILVSVLAGLAGILLAVGRYRSGLPASEVSLSGWMRWAHRQWGYDPAMMKLFVEYGGRLAHGVKRWFDEALIDGIFVHGSAFVVATLGRFFRRAQSGYVRAYAMAVFVGAVMILGYVIWTVTR